MPSDTPPIRIIALEGIPEIRIGDDIGSVIAPGETGVLVPQRDPAALARAIADLLADPARRAVIGTAARNLVAARFGWAAAAARFEAAYDRALAFTAHGN